MSNNNDLGIPYKLISRLVKFDSLLTLTGQEFNLIWSDTLPIAFDEFDYFEYSDKRRLKLSSETDWE